MLTKLLIGLFLARSILATVTANKKSRSGTQEVILVQESLPYCAKLEFVDYLLTKPVNQTDCTLSAEVDEFAASMISFLHTVVNDLKSGVDADDDASYREEIGERTMWFSTESNDIFQSGNLKERSLILDLEAVSISVFQGYVYSPSFSKVKAGVIDESADLLADIEKEFLHRSNNCTFVKFQKKISSHISRLNECEDGPMPAETLIESAEFLYYIP